MKLKNFIAFLFLRMTNIYSLIMTDNSKNSNSNESDSSSDENSYLKKDDEDMELEEKKREGKK